MTFSQTHFLVLFHIFINVAKLQESVFESNCQPEQQKYVVSIRRDSTHICSGTLLNSDWVLTGAHCKDRGLYVVAGISENPSTEVRSEVKEFHSHPRYRVPPLMDIALLRLSDPINESKYINYVNLTNGNSLNVCPNASAIGWGKLWSGESTSYPKQFQCFTVSVLPFGECQKTLKWLRHESLMCSLSFDKKKSCLDDYGGPVMCAGVQIGVIEWQIDCANPFIPGIYTRIDTYLRFIDSTMNTSPKTAESKFSLMFFIVLTSYIIRYALK